MHGYSLQQILNGRLLPQVKSEIYNYDNGKSFAQWLQNAKENLCEVKNILVDGGYTGEKFTNQIKAINIELVKKSGQLK